MLKKVALPSAPVVAVPTVGFAPVTAKWMSASAAGTLRAPVTTAVTVCS